MKAIHALLLFAASTVALTAASPAHAGPSKKKKSSTSSAIHAAPAATSSSGPLTEVSNEHAHWYGFAQLSALGAFQGGGGDSFSPFLSWNPTYAFNRSWAVRGQLGFSIFKGTDRFFVLDYRALGSYTLSSRVVLEAGLGAQSWFGGNGTHFVLGEDAVYKFETPLARYIDRAFLGYTTCFLSDHLTHQIQVGVGAAF